MNVWKEIVNGPAGIFMQVLGILLVATTLVIAFYKWRLFIQVFGIEISVTQACIVLEIVASLSKFRVCA